MSTNPTNQDDEPRVIDFARHGRGGDEIDIPDGPRDIGDKVTSYDTSGASPTEKVMLRALERIAFSLDTIDRTAREILELVRWMRRN